MSAAASARAFAPASVGNVAVGFDLLGLAIAGCGDTVSAERRRERGVRIGAVRGTVTDLPADPEANTAGRVALALLEHAPFGVTLTIDKGIALGSGMGGSAASAVAAAVAVNALLDEPLEHAALLAPALEGEAVASGARHADNVAPSLLGGLVLAPPGGGAVSLPTPPGLVCVVAHPALRLDTREGRSVLREHYALADWVTQSGHLAAFVDACHRGDLAAIGRHLRDTLIEPQRKGAIAGFDATRDRVLGAGALACSISGSGPSLFAWCRSADAAAVSAAFEAGFGAAGVACTAYVSPLDAPGARLLEVAA